MARITSRTGKLGIVALATCLGLVILSPMAGSATLTSVSVTATDSRPNTAGVSYDIKASGVTTSTIRCITVSFNTAADGSGSKPSGMNITGLTLSGSSDFVPTPASWTPSNNNTTGVTEISYATGETPASASNRHLILGGITNPSTADTPYFVIVRTFATDCTTGPVDSSTTSIIFTTGQAVTFSVDPTMSFTIAGKSAGAGACNGVTTNRASTSSAVDLGVPTPVANRSAAQDLNISTNAGSGYTIFTRYTAAPSNGSHSITDIGGSNASPGAFSAAGTEAFGYTTDDSSLGTGTANRFTNGGAKWAPFVSTANTDEVAYSSASVNAETRCVAYQIGISNVTPAGSYASTVIFTAVPIF